MPQSTHHMLLWLSPELWSLWDAGDIGSGCLLAGQWRPDTPQEAVEAIRQFVEERGTASPQVVIGLDAALCLSTRFELPAKRRRQTRASMLYKLEDSLPISAEEVIGAFERRGSDVLAICCERGRVERLVRALAGEGFLVQAVAPLTMLAATEHLRRKGLSAAHIAVWANQEGATDWVEIDDGSVRNWCLLPAGSEAIQREIDFEELSRTASLPVAFYGPQEHCPANADLIEPSEAYEPEEETLIASAGRYAMRVLRGEATVPFNLLEEDLLEALQQSHPLRWERLAAKAALVLLLLAGVFYFGRVSWSAGRQAEHLTSAQHEAFRQALPDRRVPAAGVRMRLASELRRLRGVRGQTSEAGSEVSAVSVLREVLESLPEGMRCRLLEIRLENSRLQLSGHVRSHSDADRLAASLRNEGIPVGPPSTQKLTDQGIEFRLSADLDEPKEEKR